MFFAGKTILLTFVPQRMNVMYYVIEMALPKFFMTTGSGSDRIRDTVLQQYFVHTIGFKFPLVKAEHILFKKKRSIL
jgi:hypothetical protein